MLEIWISGPILMNFDDGVFYQSLKIKYMYNLSNGKNPKEPFFRSLFIDFYNTSYFFGSSKNMRLLSNSKGTAWNKFIFFIFIY